jgi:hypothetical protein
MNLRVRRIRLASATRFGFITGAVTAAPVGIVVAGIVRVVVSSLRRLLESWQRTTIDLGLLGKTQIDLIPLLKLGDALAMLRRLDELPVLVVGAIFILIVLAAGLYTAITSGWQAYAYNSMAALSGGLEVQVEPVGEDKIIVLRGDKRQK